ncbi:MAG: C39 family peptidase [Promethearchaeota archaeon]
MKKVVFLLILILMLSIGCYSPTNPSVADVQLTIPQLYQHKDTNLTCDAVIPPNNSIHPWNHSLPYYSCPHCATYCAPASIAMIALYRGKTSPITDQDHIYDEGKYTGGEAPGDGITQTHGVGMFHDPTHGFEVQTAFAFAVDTSFHQYSMTNSSNSTSWGGKGAVSPPSGLGIDWSEASWQGPLTPAQLVTLLGEGRPVLWLDQDGWPESNPSWENRGYQGHAKVIAGHLEMGTPGFYEDDQFIIYDPWPYLPNQNIANPLNISVSEIFNFAPTRQQYTDDVFLVDSTYAVAELPTTWSIIVFLSLCFCITLLITGKNYRNKKKM